MKSLHHNFKTKQQAVEGEETCACFASIGPRSLRIDLERVSKPRTTTLKLNKAAALPRIHGVRQFQNFWEHLANLFVELFSFGTVQFCAGCFEKKTFIARQQINRCQNFDTIHKSSDVSAGNCDPFLREKPSNISSQSPRSNQASSDRFYCNHLINFMIRCTRILLFPACQQPKT